MFADGADLDGTDEMEDQADHFEEDDDVVSTIAEDYASDDQERIAKRRHFGDLTAAHRRFCLVEVAKMALYCAMYRDRIQNSFKMTGIYPLNLERALKREGVRESPDFDIFDQNISISKKRKRQSINRLHLNSHDSIEMLRRAEEAAAEKALSKAKRIKK
jgi:hypothetical protein